MTYTFSELNDMTGFANGAKFESEEDVRQYFTVSFMRDMYNAYSECHGEPEFVGDQDALDEMADAVIDNRWWCEF